MNAGQNTSVFEAWHQHWPEYLMEAGGLGLFMISACTSGTLLEHPASFLRQAIANPVWRRWESPWD